MAPPRPTYSHVLPAFRTLHPDDGCGLLPHIVWTFRRFVSLQSAGGRFRFLVPPSGTTCLSTSHLRRHSRFSDNDSRPFCFPVFTKTLSYDSCVTITIHHCCLDTRGPFNNYHYLGHVKNVYDDDDDDEYRSVHLTSLVMFQVHCTFVPYSALYLFNLVGSSINQSSNHLLIGSY